MKSLTLISVLLLTGCAQFSTTQTDVSYEKGQKTREITTRASTITFIANKSELAKFKATQTDKTQSASVGALNQEMNATNAIVDAGLFLGSVIKAAK